MLLLKTPSVLPGFKISLGLTVLCLSLLVVLPFAMMAAKAAEIGWGGFWNTIAEPERVGGGVAEFADVVLCDADQCRVRHAGGVGVGAL